MACMLARGAQQFEVRDRLCVDAFERAREARAEERVNDHVVAVARARDPLPRSDVLALDEGERRRAVARTGGEAREATDDLKISARVAFRLVNTAEEDYVSTRSQHPK